MNKLGIYIRTKRIEKGWLLRQLSAKLNIDPAYLSKIERGERSCNRELVIRIAETFSLNTEELIIYWLVDKFSEIEKEEPLARVAINLFLRG